MGLDMYLNGKRYLSTVFRQDDGKIQNAVAELLPEVSWAGNWGDSPIKQIEVEVGYWRKANAIHRWFVENVQGGEDDCRSYFVSRERLGELRALCQEALENQSRAAEILPTTEGFFFGSIDYDQGYRQDLITTIEHIDRALSLPDAWDLEYRSSW